jgi:uncharacterized RDD family membrane protein YckC
MPVNEPAGPTEPIAAGVWRRLMAWLLDRLVGVLAFLLAGMWVVLGLWGLRGLPRDWAEALVLAGGLATLGVALHVVYHVVFVGGCGQTPGQMALGIAIVREDGEPAGYGRATLRCLWGLVLGIATLGLSGLAAVFLTERRGLADWLSGTRVVLSR